MLVRLYNLTENWKISIILLEYSEGITEEVLNVLLPLWHWEKTIPPFRLPSILRGLNVLPSLWHWEKTIPPIRLPSILHELENTNTLY